MNISVTQISKVVRKNSSFKKLYVMYPSVALIQFDFSGIGFSKNLQTCIDIGVGIMLV